MYSLVSVNEEVLCAHISIDFRVIIAQTGFRISFFFFFFIIIHIPHFIRIADTLSVLESVTTE
jgi:hypothetical protein